MDNSNRVLRGLLLNDENMSIENCKELCYENNYKFAGLEFGNECFCGNDIPIVSAPMRECHLKCAGDETEICGGFWRLSVYSIPPKPPTSPWTVEITVEIACAFAWDDDYNDEDSDAYRALEQAILDFFNSIFGNILAHFGFHLEIQMSIIPPDYRRRLGGGSSPKVAAVLIFSGDANDAIDGDIDDNAVEETATEIASEVKSAVTHGVANYTGDIIDNTSTPKISEPSVFGDIYTTPESTTSESTTTSLAELTTPDITTISTSLSKNNSNCKFYRSTVRVSPRVLQGFT